MGDTVAIVLAAGKSTRMKSDAPKVLHEICGRPMLAYVLSACRLAGADRIYVVVGHGKEGIQERFAGERDLIWVEQSEQLGTGHAVSCCRELLSDFSGSVLVIAGDMPLVRREPLARLVETRDRNDDGVSLATAVLDEPSGYGRIVRGEDGALVAIVEDRDCTPEQRKIDEVNPSYYCFDSVKLFDSLEKVRASSGSGEYYLTGVIEILKSAGQGVSATVSVSREDALGVNSRLDLAIVNRAMQDRIQFGLMADGVTIVDPDNTWIEAEVTVGRETVLHPFSLLCAGATIGERCCVGPFARVAAGDVVEAGSVVGPHSFGGAKTS